MKHYIMHTNEKKERKKRKVVRDHEARSKQQRLLLLWHSLHCTSHECTETKHCAAMKRLWKHILHCHSPNCKVPHCASSRYILTHFKRCRDSNCVICKPVKKKICEKMELCTHKCMPL